MKIAKEKILVNVAFYSAPPIRLGEAHRIVLEGGAIAFKLFMSSEIGGVDPREDEQIRAFLEEVSKLKVPVSIHAEDINLMEKTASKIEGQIRLEDYLRIHSPKAETAAIRRLARLLGEISAKIHICHLSSMMGLKEISKVKRLFPITCEVTPHHLLLSVKHLKSMGSIALVDPPLRSETDIKALWKALRDGLIDIIASDHAPHRIEEKKEPLDKAKPGIPGLETTLPLMFTQVMKGRITLDSLVRMLSDRPAKIFGIRGRGKIMEGLNADLVVINPKRRFRIDPSGFYTKAEYTPFEGWEVIGKPVRTYVGGKLVMEDDEIVAEAGVGSIITRWDGN